MTMWQRRELVTRGAPVDDANPLPVTSEMAADSGVATGGTGVTLIDTAKDWEVNMWEDAILQVEIGGISYLRTITANTNDTLTFNALPGAIVVAAGCPYNIKRMVNPLAPLDKGVIHNTAYVTPNDFFVAAIVPTNTPCLFRAAGAFSAAGVLDVTITRAGNTQTMHLNHGVALTGNCFFSFDVLVKSGDTVNYQYGVNCNIMTFRVLEIPSAL